MKPLSENDIRLLLTETAQEKYDIPRLVQALRDLDMLRRWLPICIECARRVDERRALPTHEDMERALLDAGWDSSCAGGIPAGRSWRAPPGSPKNDGAYRLTRDAWALLTRPS